MSTSQKLHRSTRQTLLRSRRLSSRRQRSVYLLQLLMTTPCLALMWPRRLVQVMLTSQYCVRATRSGLLGGRYGAKAMSAGPGPLLLRLLRAVLPSEQRLSLHLPRQRLHVTLLPARSRMRRLLRSS